MRMHFKFLGIQRTAILFGLICSLYWFWWVFRNHDFDFSSFSISITDWIILIGIAVAIFISVGVVMWLIDWIVAGYFHDFSKRDKDRI